MKRYKIADDMWIEDPDGEWVKWKECNEDYKEEFFRFTEIYEKRIRKLKVQIGKECNCEEEARKAWSRDESDRNEVVLKSWWICPAHGYKRR